MFYLLVFVNAQTHLNQETFAEMNLPRIWKKWWKLLAEGLALTAVFAAGYLYGSYHQWIKRGEHEPLTSYIQREGSDLGAWLSAPRSKQEVWERAGPPTNRFEEDVWVWQTPPSRPQGIPLEDLDITDGAYWIKFSGNGYSIGRIESSAALWDDFLKSIESATKDRPDKGSKP